MDEQAEETPEWMRECPHDQTCYSEKDCDALRMEQNDGGWDL